MPICVNQFHLFDVSISLATLHFTLSVPFRVSGKKEGKEKENKGVFKLEFNSTEKMNESGSVECLGNEPPNTRLRSIAQTECHYEAKRIPVR